MSVTEKLMESIEEVLNEREKEIILSVLDSDDDINFDDFWRKKNYDLIGEKGLTSYHGYNNYSDELQKHRDGEVRKFTNYTVRNRLKSAMEKLEKSSKLRAINAFSSWQMLFYVLLLVIIEREEK
mgnify:CR=1